VKNYAWEKCGKISNSLSSSAAKPWIQSWEFEYFMKQEGSLKERITLVGCSVKSSSRHPLPNSHSLSLEESLDELAFLAASAGGEVVSRITQERDQIDPAIFIGVGKLQLLKDILTAQDSQTVVFDENLSPAQQRNLEHATGAKVIDRTQLILDIFAHRARTREGKLQVELAQLNYLLPRLSGKGVELSRLGGGIGTRGPGETKLEADQRKIRRRIHKIKEELERVRAHRHLHRSFRDSIPVPVISLVGYTNAGKSTLFNALTQAETYASNQLFATLDPLLRRLRLPSHREIILSDTVGFIHKLPHTLISAFQATLEEVREASMLLHVIDLVNPHFEQQRAAVYQVLEELKIKEKPILELYNKTDLLNGPPQMGLRDNALYVSASLGTGLDQLLEKIDSHFADDPLAFGRFMFSFAQIASLSRLYDSSRVISRTCTDAGILLEVEAPHSVLERFREWQCEDVSLQ
jgi:GTP-binding protein HflX